MFFCKICKFSLQWLNKTSQVLYNMGKVLVSLRGTCDPTVRCQNANGLIDSLMLNCLFELISTLRPLYMEECQSLCPNATCIISICHSISLWEFEHIFLKGCCPLIHLGQTFMNKNKFQFAPLPHRPFRLQ